MSMKQINVQLQGPEWKLLEALTRTSLGRVASPTSIVKAAAMEGLIRMAIIYGAELPAGLDAAHVEAAAVNLERKIKE